VIIAQRFIAGDKIDRKTQSRRDDRRKGIMAHSSVPKNENESSLLKYKRAFGPI
jgi:hypothetical protein